MAFDGAQYLGLGVLVAPWYRFPALVRADADAIGLGQAVHIS